MKLFPISSIGSFLLADAVLSLTVTSLSTCWLISFDQEVD